MKKYYIQGATFAYYKKQKPKHKIFFLENYYIEVVLCFFFFNYNSRKGVMAKGPRLHYQLVKKAQPFDNLSCLFLLTFVSGTLCSGG